MGGGTPGCLWHCSAARRALIRSLVEEAGAVVQECADGESAVARYARIRPDLVLMDIALGSLDGLAATAAIRALDPTARVIIVTEHEGARYRRAAEAAGACHCLLKRDLADLPALLTGLPGPALGGERMGPIDKDLGDV